MRPVIGVTTSFNDDESFHMMNRRYSTALISAGALLVMLPATDEPSVISGYADMIDGLVLSGGNDMDPAMYGEGQKWACGEINPVRDRFETRLFTEVLGRGNKPILGICRGIQLMNVALGGSLYQDLQTDFSGDAIAHRQKQLPCYTSHPVQLCEQSRLQEILGMNTLFVNSHHHQALKATPECFVPSAHAPDGVIEAAEHTSHPFCIGVQWHPECLWNQPDSTVHRRLFEAFVDACRK